MKSKFIFYNHSFYNHSILQVVQTWYYLLSTVRIIGDKLKEKNLPKKRSGEPAYYPDTKLHRFCDFTYAVVAFPVGLVWTSYLKFEIDISCVKLRFPWCFIFITLSRTMYRRFYFLIMFLFFQSLFLFFLSRFTFPKDFSGCGIKSESEIEVQNTLEVGFYEFLLESRIVYYDFSE